MRTHLSSIRPSVLAYPMHGHHKLLREGYRTRDGHVIEWLGRLTEESGGVAVLSRPEPRLVPLRTPHGRTAAPGTHAVSVRTARIPDPRARRRWWADTAGAYPVLPPTLGGTPAIVWNPFTALAPGDRNPFGAGRGVGRPAGRGAGRGVGSGRATVLDLLDDWSRHQAFAPVRSAVERAYAAAFAAATVVTANGEGTVALARRFGRDDVVLLPNGCDPERFDATNRATGRIRIGYVGKIGHRLDLDGILRTAAALPDVDFVFAGPVLDRAFRAPLAGARNIELLGDVHYEDLPTLLTTFDVGWVPHGTGEREVGGDVIKTYEYRAAGLPTLTTPVDEAGCRGLDGVTTRPMAEHVDVLRSWTAGDERVPRCPGRVPIDATWEHKSRQLLGFLTGVEARS